MKITLLILFVATTILMARFEEARNSRLSRRLATLGARRPTQKE
jgi:hypothetical protein